MAFDEDVLLDQDRFVTAVLTRPEFQRRMTDLSCTRLGAFYAEQERVNRVEEADCYSAIGSRFQCLWARRATAACS